MFLFSLVSDFFAKNESVTANVRTTTAIDKKLAQSKTAVQSNAGKRKRKTKHMSLANAGGATTPKRLQVTLRVETYGFFVDIIHDPGPTPLNFTQGFDLDTIHEPTPNSNPEPLPITTEILNTHPISCNKSGCLSFSCSHFVYGYSLVSFSHLILILLSRLFLIFLFFRSCLLFIRQRKEGTRQRNECTFFRWTWRDQ